MIKVLQIQVTDTSTRFRYISRSEGKDQVVRDLMLYKDSNFWFDFRDSYRLETIQVKSLLGQFNRQAEELEIHTYR